LFNFEKLHPAKGAVFFSEIKGDKFMNKGFLGAVLAGAIGTLLANFAASKLMK
jgi:NAD(P)H-hydrate repair Nnr-like enzyme with NAD(P)H-hydrate dehydratase domain